MLKSSPYSVISATGRALALVWNNFQKARHISELQHWTDHQLNDIGLTREDVRRALDESSVADRSRVLREAAAASYLSRHFSLVQDDREQTEPYVMSIGAAHKKTRRP